MNTYWRLLGFAKPIEKYAIPYFFYTLFYTIFYTFTFMLIMPLLNTLFVEVQLPEPVTALPSFALNTDYFRSLVNFLIYRVFGTEQPVPLSRTARDGDHARAFVAAAPQPGVR